MRFCVLASGSNANCTFLETPNARILIDCGLSARSIALRLAAIGVEADSIDAIFLTHEHIDHVRGLSVFSKKFKVPVYGTPKTISIIPNVFQSAAIASDYYHFLDCDVQLLKTSHDAVAPCAYIFSNNSFRFAQVTDLGKTDASLRAALQGVNALVLESNHDLNLLENCYYPEKLKARIRSNRGHLSNDQAMSLVRDIFHQELYYLVLAHLSENANTPETALNCFTSGLGTQLRSAHPVFKLHCASRYTQSPVFDLNAAIELLMAANI